MREPMRLRVRQQAGRSVRGQTVREMARLRQGLAKELKANLKQLRTVIEESQRIARELEAVLQQTRLAPVRIPVFPSRRRTRADSHQEAGDSEGDASLSGAQGLPGDGQG